MDDVGSFQSASLSGESGFGRNESSKYTDWLQCFFRVVRVFRGSKELFRLRACLKSQLSESGRSAPVPGRSDMVMRRALEKKGAILH